MQIPKALHTEKFAEYLEAIKELYKVDEDFKALCDDYNTSKMNIEKFKDRSLEDKRRELEYKDLTQDLEKEILEYITKLICVNALLIFTLMENFIRDGIF